MKKCTYCNKEITINQEVTATITSRARDANGNAIVGEVQNKYCCVECASYDQATQIRLLLIKGRSN